MFRVNVEKYSGKEKLINHVNYKNILMVENVTKYVLQATNKNLKIRAP